MADVKVSTKLEQLVKVAVPNPLSPVQDNELVDFLKEVASKLAELEARIVALETP